MKQRNLDGYYFRVKREDKYEAICFTDLTDEETIAMLDGRSDEWLTSLLVGLLEVLNAIVDASGFEQLKYTVQDIVDTMVNISLVEQVWRIKRTINNIADYYDIVIDKEELID